ncbi:MAG: hypothetical protein JNJ45_07050 [Chthonomonas sp.]|nr:hypothetical protein [Chthonomonas sp.]
MPILASAWLLAQAALPPVDEIYLPTSPVLAVAAVIDLKGATDGEEAALQVLAGCMEQGGKTYTRAAMANTDGVAQLPVVEAGQGYLLIRMAVQTSTPDVAAPMLASLITEPIVNEDSVAAAQSRLSVSPDLLRRVWRPVEFKGDVTERDVQYVLRKFVRPERVSFCLAGAFKAGDGVAAMRKANWTWSDLPERREFLRHKRFPLTTSLAEANAWTTRLPLAKSGAGVSTAMLAANLLGVGKASTMFRVLRTDLAYSYRQEATLLPTREGWLLGLSAFSTQRTTTETVAAQRLRLQEAVSKWTDADLLRAKRQWLAANDGVFPFDPAMSSPGIAIGDGAWGESAMGALNRLIIGRPLSRSMLLSMTDNPKIGDVRALATKLLTEGQVQILPAR